VTSSEFPGDPTSSAEIRLSQHPAGSAAAAADKSQMTSDDVSRSFIYLNSALLNGAIGKHRNRSQVQGVPEKRALWFYFFC